MSAHCRRLWEVEAMRDGRLVGHAQRAIEVHAETCPDCREERRALDRLGLALVKDASIEDEVALRRGRAHLLWSVEAQRLEQAGIRKLAPVAVAAALVALLCGDAVFRATQRPTPAVHVASVTASAGARWDQHLRGSVEQIRLTDGTLKIFVRHSPTDPRVMVRVPDGEIEDVGTAFRVTVQQHETREIAVDDGAVVFHKNGQESVLVKSGSVWNASVPQTLAVAPGVAPPPPPVRNEPPVVRHTIAVARHTTTSATATSSAAAVTSSAALPVAPDTAVEDATYLQILALARHGQSDAARVAAAKYLDEFPSGFRRTEVLRFMLRSH